MKQIASKINNETENAKKKRVQMCHKLYSKIISNNIIQSQFTTDSTLGSFMAC